MRMINVVTHHQAVDFNIFEGIKCHGVIQYTTSCRIVVWEKGNLNVEASSKRFVSLHGDYVFSATRQREQVCSCPYCVFSCTRAQVVHAVKVERSGNKDKA
jgi:hypothetical protein